MTLENITRFLGIISLVCTGILPSKLTPVRIRLDSLLCFVIVAPINVVCL